MTQDQPVAYGARVEDDELIRNAPDPTDTVHLLKSDFELLQKVANFAVEDTETLGNLLRVFRPEGMAPREFFHTRILPKVAALMETQSHVDEATAQLSERAARFGNKTKDFGKGVKGLKVGERIPGLFDDR